MMNTFMTLLFPFLDFIPFGLPRYWLFRDRLRIPFRFIVLVMVAISAVNSMCFYYVNLDGYAAAAQVTTLMRYGFMGINLVFSFLLIKESFPRLMYTYLLMIAWSFFVFGNANFIESHFFWDFSDQHPYLIYNLVRIIVYILTCPYIFHFLNHMIANALKINDRKLWKYMWLIPLFSTLMGILYCTADDVYAYATWQFLISRYLMLLGACYVSYIVLRVLEISKQRTQLEESLKYADLSLQSQKRQMDSLTANMEATRKARHDLRQHLAVVQSYIDGNDREGLAEYIDLYKKELPPDTMELFSRNEIVNAIVCYYAALAREQGIRFDARISLPESCPVTDTDIAVLLGNLLENAVEACIRENKPRTEIHLRITMQKNDLFILTDNTCTTEVKMLGDTLLSSKRSGTGIGAASIREIASRYRGAADFRKKGNMFYASVILRL